VVVCENPGLRATSPYVRRTSPSPPNSDIWLWAGGEMAGDFDGDGLIDVITPNEFGLELYGATSTTTYEELGIEVFGTFDLGFGTGGSVVDYDADGDLDLFVASGGVECEPSDPELGDRLYLTDGTGTFVAAPPGSLPDAADSAGAAVAADYDGDGDLDLVTANFGEINKLYRNNGTANPWNNVAAQAITADIHHSQSVKLGDLDDDGNLDVVFGNVSQPNRYYLSNGTTDPWASTGDGCPVDSAKTEPGICGCGFTDVDTDSDGTEDCFDPDDDNDGLLDIVETNTGMYSSPDNTGTDPLNPDSDGDGTDDGAEIDAGRDPLLNEPAAIISTIHSILNADP